MRHQPPGHAHQLRLLPERRQHLLQRLQQQRIARPEHVGLRLLATRQGFEVAPLRFAQVLPFGHGALGHLHRDLRPDEVALLVRGGTGLLGLDPLLLRHRLLLVGLAELLGELLPPPRHQQLRRDHALAEAELVDLQPGLCGFLAHHALHRALDGVALVHQVEHAGRPARAAHHDLRADHVPHHGADHGRHHPVLHLRHATNGGHDERRAGRRDLHQHAQLLRHVPALHPRQHRAVGRFGRHGDGPGGGGLLDLAAHVHRQVDAPLVVAAAVLSARLCTYRNAVSVRR
ncbi:MAG: TolA protein [uncultured Acetobacteraceae bacterium]|uniref:TolA protein n=1 Tax=uncultured Acetobacteraceae bacterium TaxID=169975 RepID=A0A6J4I013_9PROT|nr:MAG: TolA protein [uncultured Acetobacteraceae bacterium]